MISIDVGYKLSLILQSGCLIIHRLCLFVLVSLGLVEFDQILNIFLATEEDWATFVDVSGLNVKDPLGSRGGETSSLGGYVGDTLTLFMFQEILTCSVR